MKEGNGELCTARPLRRLGLYRTQHGFLFKVLKKDVSVKTTGALRHCLHLFFFFVLRFDSEM